MRGRDLLPAAAAILCALALAACGSTSSSSASGAGTSSTGTSSAATSASTATSSAPTAGGTSTSATVDGGPAIGFEGVPLQHGPEIAPASTTGTQPVDGVSCKPVEQLVYHIHAHLAVFDKGVLYALPAGVGIPGSQAVQTQYGPVAEGGHCYYWLHTHTNDGVIHVESPLKRIYTLGEFFNIWRQPLSSDSVGTLHGTITAFVNGKPWHQSPRAIPLLPHADIQLQIGEPIPPQVTIDWKQTHL